MLGRQHEQKKLEKQNERLKKRKPIKGVKKEQEKKKKLAKVLNKIMQNTKVINLKMSNIIQLIQKIFDSNDPNTIDSTKKLIYLAVNDPQTFSPYSAKIAKLIAQSLNSPIEDDESKKLFLQLLSEIATNYYQHIPTSYYNFLGLINLLSDQNAEVRKAAHYLLLIFIKKYQKIDEVLESYVKSIQENPEHWKVIQKIIHSFQSLLVIEPKCITYGKNFQSMDEFLRILLAFRAHQHHLIQKASDQTVNSFVKNEYAPQVLPKLDGKIMSELITYASKLNIKLSINKQNANLLYMDDKQQEEELEEIKISQSATRKSKRRLLFQQCINKIEAQNDWKTKLQAVQQISTDLSSCVESDIPEDLIDKILDLTYDYNFKTCITAMNILWAMVAKFYNIISVKKEKTQDVIIEKICDLKMAVRQIAAKILKKIYDSSQSVKSLNKKILTKLTNCSVVGKEEILSFIQECFKTTESSDLTTVLSEVSQQLLNENTRIKIKTIDCLVKLSVSNNLEECKYILQKKLNKVYYDMYLERLKEKIGNESNPMIQQNDKNYNKGNMTWQAERTSSPVQSVDKQSLTKMQFGTRKLDKSPNMIDTIDDFSYQKSSKKLESFNEKKSSSTLKNKTANTFDTFQSQETSSFKIVKKNNSVKQGNSFMSQQEPEIEEKKAPLKPNPIKRKVPQAKENSVQKQDVLVIQSKQYMDKTTEEQAVNASKYSMTRLPKKQGQKPVEQQTRVVPKEPFSIKKSTSTTKKEPHQIDYKATYYAAKEELAALDSTSIAIKDMIKNLPNDNDWNKQFDALNLIRRFIKNHEESFAMLYQNLATIMPEVLKLVESLRSSLSKNAMITLAEMCEALKKAMDPFLETIFIKLFKKSSDANSFIVEQVRKCMTSLCMYCTSSKIVSIIIMNSQTKAIPVKLKVALCVDKLLDKKSYDIECLRENPKIVGIMSTLISDGSAQVRNMIKETFEQVCQNNSKNIVDQIFRKGSSKESAQKFKKILDKEYKSGYV